MAVAPSPRAVAEFLELYLRPFFPEESTADTVATMWRLNWRVLAPEELDDLIHARSADPVVPERGVVRHDGTWFAWHRDDPQDAWTCELLEERERTLELLVADMSGAGRYMLARAVRSLLTTLACSAGWVQVHASAFSFDGRAVLIVGDKGVGKTSMLLTALTRGACFISNDRVLIKDVGGVMMARGLPHSVTVRAGTGAARVVGGTRSTYGDRQPDNVAQMRYHIADVLGATGSTITARSRVCLAVAPAVVSSGISVARVDPAEAKALLRTARRRSTSSFDPLWDAWRPQPATPIHWRGAAGIRIEYGTDEVGPAVDAIREEVRRGG